MWQRFSERARKVVFFAQEEAQTFGDGYVSTEHLLLGLTREDDSLAARVIVALGSSNAVVRAEVAKQLPRGDQRPNMDMTLTPRAKRVIDLAYDEARNLNNNYIGTEHLLLGLIREGDGLAARVLIKCGINLEPARKMVIELQESGPEEPGKSGKPMFHRIAKADNYETQLTLSRVKEWAAWAQAFQSPDQALQHDLDRLNIRAQKVMSEMERNILLGLCLELASEGSIEETENLARLRLTKQQADALAKIGKAVKKSLKKA